MVRNIKRFGYFITGFACVFIFCGVLAVWAGTDNATGVSSDSRAIYAGSNEKAVGLMFNVYSGTEYLADIMQTLKENGASATFFIGGIWAEKNDSTLSDIVENGFEIGSHGYFHKDHSKLGYKENLEEMRVTHKLIKSISGVDVRLFAPPSGAYSSVTLDAAEDMGYTTILWSKDTIDWRDHDTELICSRATSDIEGGDLILMHPTENTAEALPEIIGRIKNAGLEMLCVSDVL